MFTARPATDTDDLGALWPAAPVYRLNPDQVLVVTGADGALVGGIVMYDGGHEIAYCGGIRVLDVDRKQWAAKALLQFMTTWCKARGITMVGHGAGTEACALAMEQLGATPIKQQTLYELAL